MTLSHDFSGYSSNKPFSEAGADGGESIAALLIKISGEPNLSITTWIAFSTDFRFVISEIIK